MEELLLQPHPVGLTARNILLAEIQDKVFTESDNKKLLALPTSKEVKEVALDSNLLAAPGTDGIPSLLYSVCWDKIGSTLTDVVQAIHRVGTPEDKRIHHGINMASNAIQAVGRDRAGCGLLDLDFLAGFDWLDMGLVYAICCTGA